MEVDMPIEGRVAAVAKWRKDNGGAIDISPREVCLSENALRVLERRYLTRDETGKLVETPEQMFRRVAKAVAQVDEDPQWAEEAFFKIMADLVFLPNSPTLMNAGKELGQLSACFVLPVEDSMESIFESVKHTAIIHKSGGGTGFSFSRLRPMGSTVSSTGGVSSGPVSFMKVFDAATDVIKQGGKRRGANMGILRVDHPDIRKFIYAKEDHNQFNNFNISVAVTDAFMDAYNEDKGFDLMDPYTNKVVETVSARVLLDEIVYQAWKSGDPGVLFMDRINRDNLTPTLGEFEGTNPCGEQPLLPYESCNLGSVNLAKMAYKENGAFVLDEQRLDQVVDLAVRFLDNVIDINLFPLPEIEEMTKGNRKIGLGVMGFADLLIRLGIPYDSQDALKIARRIMRRIRKKARETSRHLAEIRGPFENFPQSTYASQDSPPLRNATLTTIAPTGTLSIIAGCSSGIEPLFALSYVRKVMDNDELIEIHPLFEEIARERGFYSEGLMRQAAEKGNITQLDEFPWEIRRLFVTAHDIAPEWHVRTQAAFQEYTDNAVSKTVNFPHDATPEEVLRVYLMAYEAGCKGVTIYRDNCRDSQVLNVGTKIDAAPKPDLAMIALDEKKEVKSRLDIDPEPKEESLSTVVPSTRGEVTPRPRPVVTRGVTERIGTGCGKLYVTINRDEEGICEIFAQIGKSGGCAASQIEGIARLISLALRSKVNVEAIVKQIKGIRCPAPLWAKGGMVLSCTDAIAKILEHHADGEGQKIRNIVGSCPDCGGSVEHTEGCEVCRLCGYTKCS
jgi:ribonucleoside-diphosphate reductase alpha chain